MHYVAAAAERPVIRGREPEEAFEQDELEKGERPPEAVMPDAPAVVTRTRQMTVGSDDERPVARGELLRAHEVEPDRYVTFTPQELRALRVETTSEMEIVRSVRLEEIDPVYFETSYYVIADKGGERAYSLLFRALKESGYVAIATVAMHGREHVVVIRPGEKGLLAHTMFYRNEIHAESEFDAGSSELAPKELELASTFVKAIAGPFAPEEFKDTHQGRLEKAIAGKVAEDRVSTARAASDGAGVTGNVRDNKTIDIMDALRRSIAQTAGAVQKRGPGKAAGTERRARKKA